MADVVDTMMGKQFGQLTVVGRTFHCGRWHCKCECSCGKVSIVRASALRRETRYCWDCGQKSKRTHGLTRTSIHGIYGSMLARCYNPKHKSWVDYGGRGIKVCKRWRVGENEKHPLTCFSEDMGPKPTPQHSIERRDNNGHYTPKNCYWATKDEQAINRRVSRTVIYKGTKYHVRDACELAGLKRYDVDNAVKRFDASLQQIFNYLVKHKNEIRREGMLTRRSA